jgi:signal transduction histidine kinase
VARHAGVRKASLRVWATADALCVQVDDAGKGFDAPRALGGFGADGVTGSGGTNCTSGTIGAHRTGGVSGMRERVDLLGGTLTLDSAPGEGTHVMAVLPLPTADRDRSP